MSLLDACQPMYIRADIPSHRGHVTRWNGNVGFIRLLDIQETAFFAIGNLVDPQDAQILRVGQLVEFKMNDEEVPVPGNCRTAHAVKKLALSERQGGPRRDGEAARKEFEGKRKAIPERRR